MYLPFYWYNPDILFYRCGMGQLKIKVCISCLHYMTGTGLEPSSTFESLEPWEQLTHCNYQ